MVVGVLTGMVWPLRGPSAETVRVGVAVLARAATRLTGPIRLMRLAT